MTKIDDELKNIMDNVYQKQQEYIKRYPERFAGYQDQQKIIRKKDEELQKLLPFRRKEIPDRTAKMIINDSNEHGEKLVTTKAEKAVIAAFKTGKILVAMLGRVGTGKTLTGCKWLFKQQNSTYISSRKFCSFSEKMTVDRAFINLYYAIPNLFIDEIDTEDNEKDSAKLIELIRSRFDNDLKTIIAMNASPREAQEWFGKRISRRIYANGAQIAFNEIQCHGEKKRSAVWDK